MPDSSQVKPEGTGDDLGFEADSAEIPAVASTARPRHRRASRPAGSPVQGPLAADFSAAETGSGVATSPATVAIRATAAVAVFQPPPDLPALRPKLSPTPAVDEESAAKATLESGEEDDDEGSEDAGAARRRRRRGGRHRRKASETGSSDGAGEAESEADADQCDGLSSSGESADGSEPSADELGADELGADEAGNANHRRRRRRRRGGDENESVVDDPPHTVVHVREPREAAEDTASLRGSTRLEAKKQRRREGREVGRRRAPIISEAEFLARRDSVERWMLVRGDEERIQIAVLEDGVLVEHHVSRNIGSSLIGNVYLGRVQNVLPSMEAAFVDIGRGRNAVLYAGEVNWGALGLTGSPKRIELALKTGDPVLVQVTKDPVGHKGARLTSQISLAGRHLVFVPDGSMTGISRRLPEKERARLREVLQPMLPENSGVIVRTAAEGATEAQIKADVARLMVQWEQIQAATAGNPPRLVHSEPDLAIRVVRDIFNEDFASMVISGEQAASQIESYVHSVSPELIGRVSRWTGRDDIFAANRIDEQIAKALDRKVWLPSGGSLVIDRTEAMTVVDVNTGRFTGSGGNLEDTVTSNNLEAAEEIVRQLRLRDIGGIIVIDFIDMVLERNRELVLRRLTECLGRDRTKHQVAEVTSLGLVQMTRKRIGQGLLETFSEVCEACDGRGVRVSTHPVDHPYDGEAMPRRRGGGKQSGPIPGAPTPSSQRTVVSADTSAAEFASEASELADAVSSEGSIDAADLDLDDDFEADIEVETDSTIDYGLGDDELGDDDADDVDDDELGDDGDEALGDDEVTVPAEGDEIDSAARDSADAEAGDDSDDDSDNDGEEDDDEQEIFYGMPTRGEAGKRFFNSRDLAI